MTRKKKFTVSLSMTLILSLLVFGHSFGQDASATAALEAANVETPMAGTVAPAAEAKKEDPGAAPAQFTQGLLDQIDGAKVALDTVWTLIAAMLVFFMNLGFASVESGLCRAKNAVTILAKNFVVFAAASIAFLVLGWGLMFGDGNPFFGTQGLFFLGGEDNSPAMGEAYKGVY
jgi:ammonium transporter, Amt family